MIPAQKCLPMVYIGGYGRSGSSLLDQVLAKRVGALSAGELCHLFEWTAKDRPCSCSRPLSRCEFWSPIVQQVTEETSLPVAALARITDDAEMRGVDELRWAVVWGATFTALAHVGVRVVVDSSKTAGGRRRPRLLRDLPQADLRAFVHLQRGLAAVVNSRRRGNNLHLERGGSGGPSAGASVGAMVGWLRANRLAHHEASQSSVSVDVAYETFVDDTDAVVAQIASASDLGCESPDPVLLAHAIAGNRMLRTTWDGRISIDDSWRETLPWTWRSSAALVERLARAAQIVFDPAQRR